jgi:hypothetical protein
MVQTVFCILMPVKGVNMRVTQDSAYRSQTEILAKRVFA